MKHTKKYMAARKVLVELGLSTRRGGRSLENKTVYQQLEDKGYVWDSKRGTWELGSTSVFTTHDAKPTGVVKIRVMAHPDDVDKAAALISQTTGLRVIETSDHYQNRKGAGVRVYLDVLLS